jgi:hypothetical protein
MTGRELIKYILDSQMENQQIVLRRKDILLGPWKHLEGDDIIEGRGLIIIEHPDIKEK